MVLSGRWLERECEKACYPRLDRRRTRGFQAVGNGRVEERGKQSGMENERVFSAQHVFIGNWGGGGTRREPDGADGADGEPAGRCQVEKSAIWFEGRNLGENAALEATSRVLA